jgi:hypothetical protein
MRSASGFVEAGAANSPAGTGFLRVATFQSLLQERPEGSSAVD